ASEPDSAVVYLSTSPSQACSSIFFFQAEDGIRDFHVTGVQTCALPIVARSTLEIDAQENLADVLGELNLGCLAGRDLAPPTDAADEALRFGRGVNQLAGELVVGLVLDQHAVQPGCDLLPAAGNEPGAAVIVPQQVVPECEPVLGIGDVVGQQLVDEPLALVGPRIVEECLQTVGRRQQTQKVQPCPAGKRGVRDWL